MVGNIFDEINGSDSGYEDADFWEEVFGDEWNEATDDNETLRGFCDGALKLWWSVKSKL